MFESLTAALDRFFFGSVTVTTITTTSHRYHQHRPINLKGFRIEENDFSPKLDALK